MFNNHFYLVAMIRPFQCEISMSMEVANEPPYLYIVQKQVQIVADEDHKVPEHEFLLRE